MKLWPAVLVFFLSSSAPASAGDIYVVAHPALAVTAEDIVDIYTGDKQFSNAIRIMPVENSALQADFVAASMKIGTDKYNSMWIKKSFRDGVNPPLVKTGDAEVIAYVRSTPGGIGYVSKPNPAVKIVKRF